MKRASIVLLIYLSCVGMGFTQTKTSVTSDEAVKWREDLRYMAQEMQDLHIDLFHSISPEEFGMAVANLDQSIPSLARHEIIVEMMRIAAMMGERDGHTSLNPFFNPNMEFHSIPVEFYFFEDGIFILAADKQYTNIVGGKILKIGNSTIEQAYEKLSAVVSQDNRMTLKQRVPKYMTIVEVLHSLDLTDNIDEVLLLVEKDGKEIPVKIKSGGNLLRRGFQGQVQEDEKSSWVKMNDNADNEIPLWLKAASNNYWFEYLEDSQTVYVQYNKVYNKEEGETIASFAHRLSAFVEAHPVERFVLDIRNNEGGNSPYNMPLLLEIIKSEKINRVGHLFTIIGRGTFSAAQVFANELDRYTNTIFLGEPTGGSVHFYGDHDFIELPNSELIVAVSPTYWQTLNPKDDRMYIFPEVQVELSSEDYKKNTDPVLEEVLRY